ncbi:DUF1796 family putative cysteine peptidase [Niallia sp. 01092]|uniref:DUF1796 family putative cysteine peptidase n=1 Tax=unclassified Niallia TaxID=2837522 RepID=UPI003FD62B73
MFSRYTIKRSSFKSIAGPLDWVGTPDLRTVSKLILNRFYGFLDKQNLLGLNYIEETEMLVFDKVNKISFNHDFKPDKNTLENLEDLPQIKEKYNRRIERFLEKTENCKRILFIRTEGKMDEVSELQQVLKQVVKNDFHILIINHTAVDHMAEQVWTIENVCAIELPNVEIWKGNNQYWKELFEDISIRP